MVIFHSYVSLPEGIYMLIELSVVGHGFHMLQQHISQAGQRLDAALGAPVRRLRWDLWIFIPLTNGIL